MSYMKTDKQRGFTIVELLIVIVVIAILAAITIVAYNGIQKRARDAERAQDISSIQKVLEVYYVDKGYFPPSHDLRSPAWRKANLTTQGEGIFINPEDKNSDNSINAAGSAVTTANYSYYSKTADGTVCTTGQTTCTSYSLIWRSESEPDSIKSINVSR